MKNTDKVTTLLRELANELDIFNGAIGEENFKTSNNVLEPENFKTEKDVLSYENLKTENHFLQFITNYTCMKGYENYVLPKQKPSVGTHARIKYDKYVEVSEELFETLTEAESSEEFKNAKLLYDKACITEAEKMNEAYKTKLDVGDNKQLPYFLDEIKIRK